MYQSFGETEKYSRRKIATYERIAAGLYQERQSKEDRVASRIELIETERSLNYKNRVWNSHY